MRANSCLIACVALMACSSGGGRGGPGVGGTASGATGGTGAMGTGGTGNTGTGGSGVGGSSPTSITGSVTVPAGQSVEGVEVFACVPDPATGDCDAAKSTSVTLIGSGPSAAFDLAALTTEPCYVIAAKDNNQNQSVDAGDLIGGIVDSEGSFVLVTPPVADVNLTLSLIQSPTGTVPAELVGNWVTVSSEGGSSHVFAANGAWTYASVYDASSCVLIDTIEITKEGYVNVAGSQITFTTTSGNNKSTNCSNTETLKPVPLTPFVETYSLGSDPGTGAPTLTLTDPTNPSITTTFTKQ